MRFSARHFACLFAVTLGASAAAPLGCYGSSGTLQPIPPADPQMGATDLPCDVAAVVARNCASCHGAAPKNGAPMSLVTAAAFQATSTVSGGGTIGARSVLRAKDATNPMPPWGVMSASEIATLETWVNGGMVSGSCPAPDVGVRCTSGVTSSRREGPTMRPGDTCMHCHDSSGEGPSYEVAGTVYPSLREPTVCAGSAGVVVELKDKNGAVYTMTTNSAGNFYLNDSSFSPPYTAKVTSGGKVRVMKSAQTSGECNACHSEPPAGGAPGRILAP